MLANSRLVVELAQHVAGIAKRALQQYDPAPFSGKTAISDFVAKKKYAPKTPKKPTSKNQTAIDTAYENLTPGAKRVTDAHRDGRLPPVN